VRGSLAVLVALVALVLGGVGQHERVGAAGGGSSPVHVTTATTATTAVPSRRAEVTQRQHVETVALQQADGSRPTVPAPVGVEAARPVLGAPLLLGQLPRPPSASARSSDHPAALGRGPPAPAGT
jgi:hypothetical protein